MTARATPTVEALSDSPPDTARLYQEGMTAGVIAAATVALWFVLLDGASGHPLYTPTVLGTAIFRRAALATPETLSVSLETVGMFTWIHVLIFAALGAASGGGAPRLAHPSRDPLALRARRELARSGRHERVLLASPPAPRRQPLENCHRRAPRVPRGAP